MNIYFRNAILVVMVAASSMPSQSFQLSPVARGVAEGRAWEDSTARDSFVKRSAPLNALFPKLQTFDSAVEHFGTSSSLATSAAEQQESNTSCHEDAEDVGNEELTQRVGYRPIEEWEEEEKRRGADMSWHERVKYDGQRFGDQVRQNDILQRHLQAF